MLLRDLIYHTPLRRAVAMWVVLAVAVSVKLALFSNDYSVYRMFAAGARHWWADQSLYASYTITEGLDGYRYSPTFAVAFTPLACLPRPLGPIFWGLVSIALLGWATHVLARDVLPGGWPLTREAWLLALVLVGSTVGIWSLQSNAFLTASIVLGLAATLRQRWWTAALFLAVPVFIKLWPMALVLLLMVYWPRQLIGRFAAVCLILAAIPFLTRPPHIVVWQYHEWYVSLTGPLQARWPGYRDAWTIWEEFCKLVGCESDRPLYHHVYTALSLVTALGVLGWCLWQRRRLESTGHLLTLILSMWASWQLLFGPATEQLTYGLIAPSASWAVLVSVTERRARWLTWIAWAMLALLPAGDIERAVLGIFSGAKTLLPLGVALFVAWLVWHERGAASRHAAE